MSIDDAINIEDLRRRAKRRLPKIAFDFIEGGCEDETCLERNEQSFARYRLLPRYLLDMTVRDQSVSLFGKTYSSPFGIAPTGLAALFRPREICCWRGGEDRQCSVHSVRFEHRDDRVSGEGCARACVVPAVSAPRPENQRRSGAPRRRCGRAHVLTVDAQWGVNAERNIRNGFAHPLKMSPSIMLEALMHPA
jgi:L-lactate dehydrogenase (cytochrome)/(S)-mandelate dehydrogenase